MTAIHIKTVQKWLRAALFTIVAGGMVVTMAAPIAVSALPAPPPAPVCEQTLLTFPTWYRGLVGPAPACELKSPSTFPGGLQAYIWVIVLNVLDIALQLVGYIAVGYVLYGGFLFMTSQGSPDGAAKARKTIQNAIIGLVVSLASVAVVNLAMSVLTGQS